jgi:hypothetical protein
MYAHLLGLRLLLGELLCTAPIIVQHTPQLGLDDDIDRPPVLELRKEGVLLDDLENGEIYAHI